MSDDPAAGMIHDETGPIAPAPASAVPAASSAPAEAIPHDAWAAAVATWIGTHVRNSPIAESAAGWNHLGTIMPHLKTMLEAELAKR
jgi:hypothetical protein